MAFLRVCCHLVTCNFKNSHQSSWHIFETGKDVLMKINIEINYDILISDSVKKKKSVTLLLLILKTGILWGW